MTTTDTKVQNLIINTMDKATYDTITPSDTELYMITDEVITGNDVINGLGYTPANTNLSNLSGNGKAVIDGSVTKIDQEIYSGSLTGTTDLPYTVNVPNDGYGYDVLVGTYCTTGSASGNYIQVDMYTSIVGFCHVSGARTRANNTVFGGGSVWLPLDSSRTIYIVRDSNFNGTAQIYARGYRRRGTNS
jgi:hypothetical protein